MRIFCDYCQKPFEIKEDELDDWLTLDPSDGSKVVMCGQCERRPTQRPPDAGDSAASQTLSPQSGEPLPEVDHAATQRR